MKLESLKIFVESMHQIWGALDSNLIAQSQLLLEELTRVSASESWSAYPLSPLHSSRELHRDPQHGFILLAHMEEKGLYRPPHDHGNGWVIYSVLEGEMEMGTYSLAPDLSGESPLIRREIYRVRQGESRVYLPGDIHDTKCLSDSVLMLRLTSCDLEMEKHQGRMRRYGAALDAKA